MSLIYERSTVPAKRRDVISFSRRRCVVALQNKKFQTFQRQPEQRRTSHSGASHRRRRETNVMADDVSMRLSGGSRLAVCPVCDKSVHVALVAMHVERCLTMHATSTSATTRTSCDAGVGTTTTTTTTKKIGRRGDPQNSEDRENEGGARRAREAFATGRSGGVLKELAAARRAGAARESASPGVCVDFKRKRVALADATNAQGGMRSFVKAVGATVARSGIDAATDRKSVV